MSGKLIGVALGCAMLAGCATLPTEPNDGIAINRVVDRVKCELGQAASYDPTFASWAGAITLTLEVDQSGSVIPSTSLSGPFGVGVYGLDVGFGATARSIQTSLVSIYFPVYELIAFAGRCPLSPRNQLEDSLGLREWVERTLALRTTGGLFKDKDKAIGYTLEFDLELSAGITPGFTLTRLSGKGGISTARKTANTLEIALFDAGLSPPRQYVERQVIEGPPAADPKPSVAPPSADGKTVPQNRPAANSGRTIVERRVTTRGRSLSEDDKVRLDTIIRQLQLKNLKLRF